MSNYKAMLNSDLSILIGVTLIKNQSLHTLHLSSLNLYDIDIQTLIANTASLKELKKLSFKRTTFMDKVKKLETLLSEKHLPKLKLFNLNMTNILV